MLSKEDYMNVDMLKLITNYKKVDEDKLFAKENSKEKREFLEKNKLVSPWHLLLILTSMNGAANEEERFNVFKIIRYPASFCHYILFQSESVKTSNIGILRDECREWAAKTYPGYADDRELEYILTIARDVEWDFVDRE